MTHAFPSKQPTRPRTDLGLVSTGTDATRAETPGTFARSSL
jgi:hypothetical protein